MSIADPGTRHETDKVKFDVTNVTSLPKVDVLYGTQSMDARLFDAVVKFGDVKGIVLASEWRRASPSVEFSVAEHLP